MHTDSRQGTLPLAEALIAWSDPALVDAIRAAQADVPPHELRQAERYTLDDLSTQRQLPARSRPFSSSEPVQKLDRAWDVLFAHFRLQVELDEIRLEGVLASQGGGPVVDLLLSGFAASFVFDPAAGAVFVGPRLYLRVQATRRNTGATAVRKASRPPATVRSDALPLRDALIAWADADLIRRVRLAEEPFSPEILDIMELLHLGGAKARYVPNKRVYADHLDRETAMLRAAWAALIKDVRSRVEDNRFELTGFQTHPVRLSEPTVIQGAWAEDYTFDFPRNIVSGAGLRFVGVQVTVASAAAPEKATTAEQPETAAAAGGVLRPPTDGGPAAQEKRSSGRKPAAPAIEAAVREHWAEIQAQLANTGGKPVWTELAHVLQFRMRGKSGRTLVQGLPPINTIRTRLPEIYAQVLTEKAADLQSGQTVKSRR